MGNHSSYIVVLVEESFEAQSLTYLNNSASPNSTECQKCHRVRSAKLKKSILELRSSPKPRR
ncbi:hypothetical protein EMIT0196P_200011 [Pseudomonas chlororaphis]